MAPKKKASHSRDDSTDLPRKHSSSSPRCIFPSMSSRSIANGRLVDFTFLEKEEFKIGNLLASQGWTNLLSTRKPIFPNLIYEFYENISFGDGTISSNVKNVKIEFNSEMLGSALGIPSDGVLLNFPSERNFKIATILGLEDDNTHVDNLDANMLNVENRLLHSIIAKIFAPRAGSFNAITDRDIGLMFDILEGTVLNFPELIMVIMKEAVGRSKAALPYGMFLTYVFESHNVKLKGEMNVALRHTDIFNAHSLHRMDYAKRNGIWTKVRSRTSDKSSLQPSNLVPTDPPPPVCSPPNFFNFDFNQPNPYLTGMSEPNPFLTEPHDIPESSTHHNNPNSALPTVLINEDQVQRIVRDLSIAVSSRSTSDSNSSVNDLSMVPHISSVYGTLNELITIAKQLSHDVSLLNSRVLFNNESSTACIKKDVEQLKSKVENFETKAEWVAYQMRTNEHQTKDAANALDHLNASNEKLSSLLEAHIGLTAASAPDGSFPHFWAPPPQQDDDRPEGSSKQPKIISSDDDE